MVPAACKLHSNGLSIARLYSLHKPKPWHLTKWPSLDLGRPSFVSESTSQTRIMLLVVYVTLLWAAALQWTSASPVQWQDAGPMVKPFAHALPRRQALASSIPAPQPPPPEAYATAMPGLSPVSDYPSSEIPGSV